MKYNTQRSPLYLPEYGRNLQSLVEHCKMLPTKKERNEMATKIVEFMGRKSPHLKDEEDYKQKLWNHLFILADHDLDVDSPHRILTKEELRQKPKRMDYPPFNNEYRLHRTKTISPTSRPRSANVPKQQKNGISSLSN